MTQTGLIIVFRMKIVSIILTIILALVLVNTILLIHANYLGLSAFGVKSSMFIRSQAPFINIALVYLVAVAISLFFNWKKRYLMNVSLCGIMVIVYFIIPFLHHII
ncbi:hypothetical protein SAMN05216490_1548 [Mucilaginibacter mallensis]|uniref:Uncharacterized protein n=1 Tax=Mucilaginibacter mallensis TaxID=652787 RepID=A0A1H1TY57_MUCMA|nr:hypothetical protein SAMN05216490_1548 [Mucilaginibacter mallensis]